MRVNADRAANVGSEEYDYALIIAQLEEELKEIEE